MVLGGAGAGHHMYASLPALTAFVVATELAVPPGTESHHLDIDGDLDLLLRGLEG